MAEATGSDWTKRIDKLLAGNLTEQVGTVLEALVGQVADLTARTEAFSDVGARLGALEERLTSMIGALKPAEIPDLSALFLEQTDALERKIEVVNRQLGAPLGRVRVQLEEITKKVSEVDQDAIRAALDPEAIRSAIDATSTQLKAGLEALSVVVSALSDRTESAAAAASTHAETIAAGLLSHDPAAALSANTAEIAERLEAVKTAIQERLEGRLEEVSRRVEGSLAALPAPERFEETASAMKAANDRRFEAFEQQISSLAARVKAAVETLSAQVTTMSQRVEAADARESLGKVAEGLALLTGAVDASIAAAVAPLQQDIAGLGEATKGLQAIEGRVESLASKLNGLDAMSSKLDGLAGISSNLEGLSSKIDGLARMSSVLDGLGAVPANVASATERLRADLEGMVASMRSAIAETSSELTSRLEGTAAELGVRLGSTTSEFGARIEQVGSDLGSRVDQATEALGARTDAATKELSARVEGATTELSSRVEGATAELLARVDRSADIAAGKLNDKAAERDAKVEDAVRGLRADLKRLEDKPNEAVGVTRELSASLESRATSQEELAARMERRLADLKDSIAAASDKGSVGPEELAAALAAERAALDAHADGLTHQIATVIGSVVTSVAELREQVRLLNDRPEVPPILRDELVRTVRAQTENVARAVADTISEDVQSMLDRISLVDNRLQGLPSAEQVGAALQDSGRVLKEGLTEQEEQLKTLSGSVGAMYVRLRAMESALSDMKIGTDDERARLGLALEGVQEMTALEDRLKMRIEAIEQRIVHAQSERDREFLSLLHELADTVGRTERAKFAERLRMFGKHEGATE